MSVIKVSTSAQLIAAAKTASSGDIIQLASGTYDNVALNNIKINGNVTITSQNSGNPAVLSDLTVRQSSGFTFSNLELAEKVAGKQNGFLIFESKNIVLDHLDVHGLDNLGSGKEISPLLVRNSNNVTVSNSEFHNVFNGLSLIDNSGVKVSNNYFHDVRTDGVHGGGNSNITITGNAFTDFYPAEDDHADAIQLWTRGTTERAHDIVISDNLVVRGNGDPMQGIFVSDQVGTLPFERLTITGNTVVGAMYNGIAVSGVVGGLIANNVVTGLLDQKSWVSTLKATGVEVRDNVATAFAGDSANVARNDGNKLTYTPTEGGAALFAEWLGEHSKFTSSRQMTAADTFKLFHFDPTTVTAVVAPEDHITNIYGTRGADKLIVAKFGNSHIEAGAGNDTLVGGEGRNELIGGLGDDTYLVKAVGDLVIESAGGGNDTVSTSIDYKLTANVEMLRLAGNGLYGEGNELDNRITGSVGNDRIDGAGGHDTIQGGDGHDRIWGGLGNDMLRGDAGDDQLWGGKGDDKLQGGTGDDFLFGGDGNDTLEGGSGNDIMEGGLGKDVFLFRVGDLSATTTTTIVDFARGLERIDLGMLDSNTKTGVNDAFRFIGTADFHKVAGELRYGVSHGDSTVSADLNGDGRADFTITLQGVTLLSATDFVL